MHEPFGRDIEQQLLKPETRFFVIFLGLAVFGGKEPVDGDGSRDFDADVCGLGVEGFNFEDISLIVAGAAGISMWILNHLVETFLTDYERLVAVKTFLDECRP